MNTWKVYAQYFLSTLLWATLNPFGIRQSLAQVIGQVTGLIRWLRQGPVQDVPVFSLPVVGGWRVYNGGVDRETSHSWDIITQRYAYDLVVMDDQEKTYQGKGASLKDYYAFGQAILAPGDGTVIEVRDGVRDFPHPGQGWIDWRTRDMRGNCVVIRHGQHVYSLLGHLQRGSVLVKVGDRIQQGEMIGRCGNSGHSTEPHLHIHLQDHPNFYTAVGLPMQFAHFERQRSPEARPEAIAQGYLTKGEKVAPLDDPNNEGIALPSQAGDFNRNDLAKSITTLTLNVVGYWVVAGYLLRWILGWVGLR